MELPCASPRRDDIEVAPNDIEFFEKVGTGCTAEVFRGQFRGTEVAIKVIEWNKRAATTDAQQKAFDREVNIMTNVKHPNLVHLYGICSLERPLRVITEFCAGGCCFELLHNMEEVELKLTQQLKMSIDVASAMEYLHAYKPEIIHRDLKSLNLLLLRPVRDDKDIPVVKVSDFGLARMKEASSADWGKMTIAAGTCHWMAPEVHYTASYDNKVDVYSFSMILFEMICREIPFEEEEPANVGNLILQGQRPDLEAVPPDTPPPLQDLMIKCWDAVPSERPAFPQISGELRRVAQSLGMS